MASFKCLIFIALIAYTVADENVDRTKRSAYYSPSLHYSAPAAVYSYQSATFHPTPSVAPAKYASYGVPALHAAPASYVAPVYAAQYDHDDGSYWPGKYDLHY